MRGRIATTIVLIALFLILGGLSFAVSMYFDYLWFQELGKTTIFTTQIKAKSLVGSVVLLVTFLFLYLNFLYANRARGEIQIGIPTPTGQITAYTVKSAMVQRIAGLVALLIGLFGGLSEAANWETIWRWLNRVEFNAADPIFSRDVSFYVFSLPFGKSFGLA